MDTEPLAPDAKIIINNAREAFEHGIATISKLTDGITYLCHETGADIPGVILIRSKLLAFLGHTQQD